ncbi:Glycosyl transferases group 1 [Planctomycetes bacterium Poly30]|uniref:tRNA-queuosine alpha-mannosyltransferase n=1 Tax=Saltatorellus ferox TaxID=2528018 RepID=A0A518EXX1_9BACT|nr:Glycosyl transferases group 1 [Planctomycetes bacterium Poly30]
MEVVFFEPWYGGSHRAFLDAWTRRSRHRITVHGLPPRHWKWRQEASAWELARRVQDQPAPDVIACSDFMDLPRLMGFLPESWRSAPTLAYFHENQLTYEPAPKDGGERQRDFTHGFSNILTAVRAEALVFNSGFHRAEFGAAATELLRRLPRPNPRAALAERLKAARVVAPLPELAAVPLGAGPPPGSPLRVVFPHRLEPDKDPRTFFGAIEKASARVRLEIVALGGALDQATPSIQHAASAVAGVTLHAGYCPSREDYIGHLGQADVVVSTARHEFFGIAFAESMAAGCTPLAPDRLNYPALVAGSPTVDEARFTEGADLVERLVGWASDAELKRLRSPANRAAQRSAVLDFDAEAGARALDEILEGLPHRPVRAKP